MCFIKVKNNYHDFFTRRIFAVIGVYTIAILSWPSQAERPLWTGLSTNGFADFQFDLVWGLAFFWKLRGCAVVSSKKELAWHRMASLPKRKAKPLGETNEKTVKS